MLPKRSDIRSCRNPDVWSWAGIAETYGRVLGFLTGCSAIKGSRGPGRSPVEIRFVTRYEPDEMRQGARLYAEKLNRAKGPVKFLVPLRGWSSIDKPGSVMYNPEEDRAFVDELKAHLKPEIQIEEIDCNLEDREFAHALVESFDEMFKKKH